MGKQVLHIVMRDLGTGSLLDFETGSEFSPYVTTVAYLMTTMIYFMGRLAKPIKNDKELDISFVVRFDT